MGWGFPQLQGLARTHRAQPIAVVMTKIYYSDRTQSKLTKGKRAGREIWRKLDKLPRVVPCGASRDMLPFPRNAL